jgi:hypothetical protein
MSKQYYFVIVDGFVYWSKDWGRVQCFVQDKGWFRHHLNVVTPLNIFTYLAPNCLCLDSWEESDWRDALTNEDYWQLGCVAAARAGHHESAAQSPEWETAVSYWRRYKQL